MKINVIDEPIVLKEEDFEDIDYRYAATVIALSNVYPLNENNQIIREIRAIAYKDLDYSYYPLWNDAYWNGYSKMAMKSIKNSDFLAVYLDNIHFSTVFKACSLASAMGNGTKICLVQNLNVLKRSCSELYNKLLVSFNLIIDTKNVDGLDALSMFFRPIGDAICDSDIEMALDHFATSKELFFRQITIEDGDSFSHINFVNEFDDLIKSKLSTSFIQFEYPSSLPKDMIATTEAIWTSLLLDTEDNILTTTVYSEDGKCRIKALVGESELLIEG